MHNPCYKFWKLEDGNHSGECCCNCEYQRPITGHPWNKTALVKGRMIDTVGYGCCHPEFFPHITFFENKHGMCEVWEENKWREELAAAQTAKAKEDMWAILTEPIEENK